MTSTEPDYQAPFIDEPVSGCALCGKDLGDMYVLVNRSPLCTRCVIGDEPREDPAPSRWMDDRQWLPESRLDQQVVDAYREAEREHIGGERLVAAFLIGAIASVVTLIAVML